LPFAGIVPYDANMSRLVEAEIWTVAKTDQGNAVLVKPVDGDKAVPIFIGQLEAQNILLGLGDVEIPRPLTHDLLLHLLQTLEAKLVRVDIHTLNEGTYYSSLILEQGGRRFELDSRPSDSLALAVRADCPIYIDVDLVEESGVSLDQLRQSVVEGELGDEDEEDEPEPTEPEASEGAELTELDQLKAQLEQAVSQEHYEEAASLRDRIKKLEDS
jgi:bifunctional DNase/RNase